MDLYYNKIYIKICIIYLLQNGQKSIINHLLLSISTSPVNSIQCKIFFKYIICNNSKTIKNRFPFIYSSLIILITMFENLIKKNKMDNYTVQITIE